MARGPAAAVELANIVLREGDAGASELGDPTAPGA